MERNIPYYISRHNFERTDFVKWLEACSVWINDKGEMHSNYYDEYDYRYDSICSKRYYPSRYINELKKKFE